MLPDAPLSVVDLSIAVPMLLGEKFPDATVGLTLSKQGLTRAVWRGGDGTMLLIILPFHWPFASADDPDKPADEIVMCTGGSLRDAIVSGSAAEGLLNFEAFREPTAEDVDPDWYDARSLDVGKQAARLTRRSLERFKDRVRSHTSGPVKVTASFHLTGDAIEFVRHGAFNADTELVVTVTGTQIGLTGERAAIFW